jgi:hypothetical protein
MERCSSLVIMEIQIRATVRHHHPPRYWIKFKRQKMLNVDKDMEQPELLCADGRVRNGTIPLANCDRFLKINILLP